jgi:hypothetical protein
MKGDVAGVESGNRHRKILIDLEGVDVPKMLR